MTPGAISQQMRILEEWLGTPLFKRDPKGLTLTEAGLETAFGTWPASCVQGDMPEAGGLDLLVHADELDLAADEHGLTVRDVHPLGSATRVLLADGQGQELTLETEEPVNADKRYRVSPRSGSVRAFSRD